MPSVIIFDDDPEVGGLVADIVRGRGLTVEHHLTAAGIVDIVRESKPRLVFLDIMMPGVDGLSACRALREHPATRHVKTVMLTSKTSALDQETAKRYGADMYLTKPFSAGALSMAVASLLKLEPVVEPAPAPAAPVAATVLPGATIVEAGDVWLVLDAGLGTRRWVETRRAPPREAWVLLTRYEPAAILEADVVGLMLAAGARVRLAGPDVPGSPLHSLAPQFMRASGVTRTLPLLQTLREGELPIGPGLTLYAQYALHPGTTLAYRLDAYGRRIVFCPAHAPSPDPAARDSHDARKFRTLFSAADVLVHGFSRSLSERGDGAAWEAVVDHAAAAGVKQLLLVPLDGAVPADLPERVAARASALRLEARLATGEVRVVL